MHVGFFHVIPQAEMAQEIGMKSCPTISFTFCVQMVDGQLKASLLTMPLSYHMLVTITLIPRTQSLRTRTT